MMSEILLLCVECRRGQAMRILSVCLSVRLSVCRLNEWIVTKGKKDQSRFLHHTKDHLV